jgi:hypothetical protein
VEVVRGRVVEVFAEGGGVTYVPADVEGGVIPELGLPAVVGGLLRDAPMAEPVSAVSAGVAAIAVVALVVVAPSSDGQEG